MAIKRKETKTVCKWCGGAGYELGEVTMGEHSMTANCITCKPCKGTGEHIDYYYEITYKNFKFIVDTLK